MAKYRSLNRYQYPPMKPIDRPYFLQRFNWMQREMMPVLADEVGSLSPKLEQLAHLLDWTRVEDYVMPHAATGRPAHERGWMANAFVAKCVLGMANTRALIERLSIDRALRRLCGFSLSQPLPSESTFSRAFAEFSEQGLAEHAHEQLIKSHLGERLIGHISRDSTAIEAREKPVKPGKGTKQSVAEQRGKSLATQLNAIPTACTRGTKQNAQGYKHSWNGYKLHIDTADCGVPIAAVISSASLHDSLAAIPLSHISAQRVDNLYDLMDAAYCSLDLHEHSRELGHIPIIDHNPRGGEKEAFDPCDERRYAIRSSVERTNARLKEEFGGRQVTVRGAKKVMNHLMFGLLVLSADQLMRLSL